MSSAWVKKQAIRWALDFALSSLRTLAAKLEQYDEDDVAAKVDDIRTQLRRTVGDKA
jgi:hypothetical protein